MEGGFNVFWSRMSTTSVLEVIFNKIKSIIYNFAYLC